MDTWILGFFSRTRNWAYLSVGDGMFGLAVICLDRHFSESIPSFLARCYSVWPFLMNAILRFSCRSKKY